MNHLNKALEWFAESGYTRAEWAALITAAQSVAEAPKVWLCVEPNSHELRVSNGPGGPDHCYFTSKERHLPACGWKSLVEASRQGDTPQ